MGGKCGFPIYGEYVGEWGTIDDAEGDLGDQASIHEVICEYTGNVQSIEKRTKNEKVNEGRFFVRETSWHGGVPWPTENWR